METRKFTNIVMIAGIIGGLSGALISTYVTESSKTSSDQLSKSLAQIRQRLSRLERKMHRIDGVRSGNETTTVASALSNEHGVRSETDSAGSSTSTIDWEEELQTLKGEVAGLHELTGVLAETVKIEDLPKKPYVTGEKSLFTFTDLKQETHGIKIDDEAALVFKWSDAQVAFLNQALDGIYSEARMLEKKYLAGTGESAHWQDNPENYRMDGMPSVATFIEEINKVKKRFESELPGMNFSDAEIAAIRVNFSSPPRFPPARVFPVANIFAGSGSE